MVLFFITTRFHCFKLLFDIAWLPECISSCTFLWIFLPACNPSCHPIFLQCPFLTSLKFIICGCSPCNFTDLDLTVLIWTLLCLVSSFATVVTLSVLLPPSSSLQSSLVPPAISQADFSLQNSTPIASLFAVAQHNKSVELSTSTYYSFPAAVSRSNSKAKLALLNCHNLIQQFHGVHLLGKYYAQQFSFHSAIELLGIVYSFLYTPQTLSANHVE